MNSYKVTFLINPISGGGQGKRVARHLKEIMDSFGYREEDWYYEFTNPDDIEGQIFTLLKSTEKIIAVGGDGTMSLLMTCMLKSGEMTTAGLIPLGTGNDLARIFGIYDNYANKGLLNTIRKLIQGDTHSFDLWNIDNANTLAAYISFGMDAKVACLFNRVRSSGKIPGKSAWINKLYYFKIFLREYAYKIKKGSIQYIGEDDKKYNLDLSGYTSLLIANIGSYGGGVKPFRDSNYQDGLLEILPVKSLFKFMMVMVIFGQHRWIRRYFGNFIRVYKAKVVALDFPDSEYVQLDGEDFKGGLREGVNHIQRSGQVKLLTIEDI